MRVRGWCADPSGLSSTLIALCLACYVRTSKAQEYPPEIAVTVVGGTDIIEVEEMTTVGPIDYEPQTGPGPSSTATILPSTTSAPLPLNEPPSTTVVPLLSLETTYTVVSTYTDVGDNWREIEHNLFYSTWTVGELRIPSVVTSLRTSDDTTETFLETVTSTETYTVTPRPTPP